MTLELQTFRGGKQGIRPSKTTRDDLRGDEVLLDITASGLCGTDLHYKEADMVLGHEGVGVVRQVGPAARFLKPGQRVGWGYLHDSCGHCQHCLKGSETLCPERHLYGEAELDQGSFARQAVWREAFLFRIPEGMSDEHAAPLQCGGATVFNALHSFDVQPTSRVGIIGVGGLGHLAIEFASKMGCDVVVLSGSNSKREEAMKLGANHFVATKEVDDLQTAVGKPLDALLVTTSSQPDWSQYMPIMNNGATIFPLSVSGGNFEIPYGAMLTKALHIQGTIVASRYVHERMLAFASLHGIKPMINKFPMTEKGIAEAVAALEQGKLRYRGVLVPEN